MNAHAWQVLGLAPTDDVRAIKRAYAACLKRCRPEDDPEGFARLRSAYEMLLARVAARPQPVIEMTAVPAAAPVAAELAARQDDEQEGDETPEHATRPAGEPVRATAQIAADVLQHAEKAEGHDASQAFAQWLASQPDLMLLDRKPLVSRAVLAGIIRGASVLPPAFALLQEFFHWDDQAEQRRLAQAGCPVDAARGRVQAEELRRAIARGTTRGKAYELDCQEILDAGDGRGAWWLAIKRSRSQAVPAQLQLAIRQYGYPAVEHVFGKQILSFWQRALDPRPTRLQWVMALAKPLLIGVGIILAGLISMLLGRLVDGPQLTDAPDGAMSFGQALVPVGLAVMVIGSLLRSTSLIGRWVRTGPVARALRVLGDARDALALDRSLWRGVLATAILFALAWYWPAAFEPWPFLLLVALLVLFYLRDRRSLTALAIVWWGASAAFVTQKSPTLLSAAAMPACLWLGHAVHAVLQRWRIGKFSRSTAVLATCLIICLLLLSVGVAATRAA